MAAFILLGGLRLRLTSDFFVVRQRTRGARRTFTAVAELADVNLQFINRAAEGIAVHAELPRSAALISFVFFEHGRNETPLELTDRFGIKNIAAIHLLHECFELIFHGISLFSVTALRSSDRPKPEALNRQPTMTESLLL